MKKIPDLKWLKDVKPIVVDYTTALIEEVESLSKLTQSADNLRAKLEALSPGLSLECTCSDDCSAPEGICAQLGDDKCSAPKMVCAQHINKNWESTIKELWFTQYQRNNILFPKPSYPSASMEEA